jgi:CRP/FNR family transcriptional regulator
VTELLKSHDVNATGHRCHHDYQINCGNCRLNNICLPIALDLHEVEQLERSSSAAGRCRRVSTCRQDQPFGSVFAVRSGSVKAYAITDNGQEQVTGFYFPGEILGMDGIAKNKYASSARALETASICEIPFDKLGELSQRLPNLQRHFFQLMSQEIAEDQQLLTLLSKNTADQRVATLMLSISARNKRRKLSAANFRLPMSRTDIGNYSAHRRDGQPRSAGSKLACSRSTTRRSTSSTPALRLCRRQRRLIFVLDAGQAKPARLYSAPVAAARSPFLDSITHQEHGITMIPTQSAFCSAPWHMAAAAASPTGRQPAAHPDTGRAARVAGTGTTWDGRWALAK